jgi:hypothetical protein
LVVHVEVVSSQEAEFLAMMAAVTDDTKREGCPASGEVQMLIAGKVDRAKEVLPARC